MKQLWTNENVSFSGEFYSTREITLFPRPFQSGGPPLWVGGRSRAAFRRAGRLADGWLASSVTPEEVAAGIDAIRAYAAEAGREIPDDHYGVVIPYCFAADKETALDIAGAAIRRRHDVPPLRYSALGKPEHVRHRLGEYIKAGASKFVMRACGPKESLRAQVEMLAGEVIPAVQTPFTEAERAKRSGPGQ
jgi:alkanesulfonate monooxygenase SsuD/methylene tetrahydromethanopterin reductase-like flavin-dependent oxidoreductase (luciferase family)